MAEITIIPAKDRSDEVVRTAAYARVSSDSEDQLNSFAAQIRYYTELLQNSTDAVFVDMYADQGITGTSAAKRTEFQRLMSDCRKGKIDRILTKSISRFARNTKDSLEAVRDLKTLGVSVYFEKENIDTGEISSEMMLAIYSQFAQEESMSISRNVRMGFQKRMADGSYVPSAVPFGYIREKGKLVIDKEKAEIVRGIFSDYLNGVSAEQLAKKYRVKLATVKYVLTNEKYTGDFIFHKWYTTDTLPFDCRENRGERDKYYVSETHPAIISREIFQSVQRLIERKGKSLKTIAAEMQIPYNMGKAVWNKNMVCRVLENRKYIGENDYPQIITSEDFNMSARIKAERNNYRKPAPQNEPRRQGIMITEYEPTDEIQRMTNEINRLLDSENLDKEKVEALIIMCAQLKYTTVNEVRT